VLVAAALACAGFLPWFAGAARQVGGARSARLRLRLGRETRLVLSYSLFVVIANIDILVGCWRLSGTAVGVYAASALLPKAIVLATLPVAQIVLPVIVERRAGGLPVRQASLTAAALVLGMAATAAIALWLALPPMQASALAIRGLDIDVARVLAVGAVGLGSARVLLVAEIALGRNRIGLIQGAVLAIFALAALLAPPAPAALAALYAGICWAFFVAATIVLAAGLARPSAEPA
jgi:hypothetical protein